MGDKTIVKELAIYINMNINQLIIIIKWASFQPSTLELPKRNDEGHIASQIHPDLLAAV